MATKKRAPAGAKTWRNHEALTFNGSRDSHKDQPGRDYHSMTLGELFDGLATPAQKPKDKAPAFIPSSYRKHDGRAFDVQRQQGRYVALTGDIDKGDHTLEEVAALAQDFAGAGVAVAVYSSASKRPGAAKWRVIIPLAEQVSFEDWHAAQWGLVKWYEVNGVELDTALTRAAQTVYLPNVPTEHVSAEGEVTRLRGDDGAPLFYEWRAADGGGLSLSAAVGMASDFITAARDEIEQQRQQDAERARVAQAKAAKRAATGAGSVVDRFNDSHDLDELLTGYGYTPGPGASWRSPYQTSKTFGTSVVRAADGGARWVSVSGSDADAGLGQAGRNGARFGDAFDLFAHFEHGGDFKRALKAITPKPERKKAPAPAPAAPDKGEGKNEASASDQGGPVADGVADVHDLPQVLHLSWPHMSDKGQALNTIPNLEHLLRNYGFTVRYDVIRKDMVIRHPGQYGTPDNLNQTALNTVLSLCALNRLPKTDTPSFLLNIGDRNPVNPVLDFITVKPWDGRSRFAELLDTVKTRAGFDRELFALILRRWLVSAVAAAAKPSGFWSKGVLVFQGPQSEGKTAWFRALLPESMRSLVKVDATINPDNKDTVISALSHWLVELGELDGTLRKADIARLKGFISQDVDQFRRPYGRTEEKFQRRTVFFASVNPEQFLADDTGNVRWWTVPVTGIQQHHSIDMQQLWAEVFGWFAAGEQWWMDKADEVRIEASNSEHQRGDPIDELIASRYDFDKLAMRLLTATEVLIELGYEKPSRTLLNEAGSALKRHFGEWTKYSGRKVFKVPNLL